MSRPRRDPDLVRAYVRTGGRSRPTRALDLVTLVVAAQDPPPGATADARRIVQMCRQGALTLAEIAAYLDLPPSVVKIVAADLLDSGHLVDPTPAENVPEQALLKEVLNGLRALIA
ncbi:DUF742 domain-containing protein [Nocardia sp. NPDC020380]|jgi:hypothetical protein|uniref:DUF742 domain-containing protein n=1 Tax=unclassified Nocardia TaxID=2637762 RepID=UPI0037B83D32